MAFSRLSIVLLSLCALQARSLPAATVNVNVAQPGAAINPAMWGIFFEDINFGADGGLYAELVKNRGFEFPEALMGWSKLTPPKGSGEVAVREDNPFNSANPHYVRVISTSDGPIGLSNEGFRGIGLKQGEDYNFSVRARNVSGSPKLTIRLYGSDGAVLDSLELKNVTGGWAKYEG